MIMSIVAASHLENVLDCTLAYLELGISVLPVKGKQAAVSWSRFQTQIAPFSFVHNWHRANLLQGVAIVCGKVSGNLAVIDLDGIEAVNRFNVCFPELLDTFTVVSGSGNGRHLYFYCDDLPPTTRTKGFELRCDGCYVVAPPSIHPVTGRVYQPNDTEVKRVSDLRAVVEWIRDMIDVKPPARESTALPAIRKGSYGSIALLNECANVRNAQPGQQNNVLNRAAFKLGQLVAANVLTFGEVESALLHSAAALSSRDGEHATLRTIHSGLNAGMTRISPYRRNLTR